MRIKTCRCLLAAFTAAAMMAAVPVTVYASPLDVENINTVIEQLPEREDLTEEDYVKIDEAMQQYRSLMSAEKLDVINYKKLQDEYDWAVQKGFIQKEPEQEQESESSDAEAVQQSLAESGKKKDDATQYVFSIDKEQNSATILIHYTTDLDGDGNGDMPSLLNITSPTDKTYSLTDTLKENTVESATPGGSRMVESALKSNEVDMTLLWQERLMQIDIAKGPVGKWKIISSDPVYFNKISYAGARMDIEPEDGQTSEAAETELEQEAPPEKEKDNGNVIVVAIVLVVVLIAAAAFAAKKTGIFKKRFKEDDEEDSGSPDGNERTMDSAYESSMDDYEDPMQDEYTDDDDPEEEDEEYDEDDEYLDDDEAGFIEYTETGNTGLLNPEDRPTDNGGGMIEDDGAVDDGSDDDDDDDDDIYFQGM